MAETLEMTQAATPGTGVWDRWRPSVISGFWTWAAALMSLIALTAVSWLPFQDLAAKAGNPPNSLASFLDVWHRWDTTWYLNIAENGYGTDSMAPAFFPVYPLVVRAVDPLVPGGIIAAGLFVSVLACLIAMILIHRLVTEALSADDARRTIFYLLAYPTAFFLMAAYNESLFLAFAVGALYSMRKGRWWAAGALAGLASGTRLVGVLLGLAFAYEYLRQREFKIRRIEWDVFSALLVPMGLLGYMAFLNQRYGNPTAFLKAQEAWGRSDFAWPWTTAGKIFEMLGTTSSFFNPDDIRNIVNLITAAGTLALLILAVVGPWKLPKDSWYMVVFAAAVLLLPLTHPLATFYPLSSLWRYILECLPAFMVVARMGRNPNVERGYLFLALTLQGVMVISFVQNQFVA